MIVIDFGGFKNFNFFGMDLRIVNTCNNDCLYCLESSLRNKEKFIDKNIIFSQVTKNKSKGNITFYWWNPLLHPDLKEIISFCKKSWYKSIWLLTNSFWLSEKIINDYIDIWLTTIWIYFNSFSKVNHEIVNWDGISYSELLSNIKIVLNSNINLKVIIHINNLNLSSLYKDVYILNKKFWINNIDFVNYFPFDKPYKNKNYLEYSLVKNKKYIILLFSVLKKIDIKFNFLKFSKDFFFDNNEYYSFKSSIENQIGDEDYYILNSEKEPFCFIEKRCNNCFLKDVCKFYK